MNVPEGRKEKSVRRRQKRFMRQEKHRVELQRVRTNRGLPDNSNW